MICVTGSEPTIAELRARLERYATAELQEVRLDLIGQPTVIGGEPGISPERLLLTCRPVGEGGGFDGTEHERARLLERQVTSWRPAWVDVESSTPDALRTRLFAAARSCGTKILVSRHELQPGASARSARLVEQLAELGGDAIKLAVAVDDAAELLELREAARSAGPPAVVIGIGPAGLLSRALYRQFHSRWTYAAADSGRQTAPSQLTAQTFRDWRLPPRDETRLYVLLGGPQVIDSPGPSVYNRLFAEREVDACYLPVVTDRLRETLALLIDLGLGGASVTMPLKQRVVELLGELGSEARQLGVVNTVTVRDAGELRGDLTDGAGAVAALERFCDSVEGRQVAVLGTGGTAAAIAGALQLAGAQVTVLGRNARSREELATRLAVPAGSLEDLAATPFDVLVNATPVGAGATDKSLIEDSSLLAGKLVLDVIHGERTRLLQQTREAGGQPISGRVMWAEQGRRQLKRWFGIDVPAAELERG